MADDKAKEAPQKTRHADPATIKCRVHRTNCAQTNEMIPITVNAVGRVNGKKVFVPKSLVTLTQAQVNNLKDAREDIEILLAEDSAVYQNANPVQAAQALYPGYRIIKDPVTGFITAVKEVPNYIVVYDS